MASTSTNGHGRGAIGGLFLTNYFLATLFCFACMSIMLNSRFAHMVAQDVSIIESYLKDSAHAISSRQNGNDVPIITHAGLENPHAARVAGLNCDKYGGPSTDEAQEMVYWEDVPSDAEWISPFHAKHRNGPPQYLTFEPDLGGWNNIR
jgi:hypothetical protein